MDKSDSAYKTIGEVVKILELKSNKKGFFSVITEGAFFFAFYFTEWSCLDTVPFFKHQFLTIFKRLFLLLQSWSGCIRIGLQNNSSHIVLCRKSIPLGAFLVPVPINKPSYQGFILKPVQIISTCEELRSSVVETRKHLRLISRRNRPNRTGRFFCAFLKVI